MHLHQPTLSLLVTCELIATTTTAARLLGLEGQLAAEALGAWGAWAG